MRTYIVGGAVRDALLGLPVKDRDWVVVGETAEAMLARGFRPVGRDFPVFLHPETHEEYALARTERKTGRGHTGFVCYAAPDVTLEEDLSRRDLTINAIAQKTDGTLIDPYGGVRDLENKTLRHVGPAFSEDPLRVLRVARFAARFPDFSLAPETLALMRAIAESGELNSLTPERVWKELSRGLMESRPSRMFRILRESGALVRVLPELDALFGIPQPPQYHPEVDTGEHVMMVIDHAAQAGHGLDIRWACLLHDLGKGETPAHILPSHHDHESRSERLAKQVSNRLRVPAACRDFAVLFAREHGQLGLVDEMRPGTVISLLERCDCARRPERFQALLEASACDYFGRGGHWPSPWPAAERWHLAMQAFSSVDAGALASTLSDSKQIPVLLHEARTRALRAIEGRTGEETPPSGQTTP
ncbi:MAG: multifunctional CCA addition/repair protein [Azoarcus sp.]|jgi:tRNA nucleotidyltransferase (CCA-adding enzyme)|nr:multifunctional CCA addition/repair protein [Azoarcus sp.]